MKVRAQNITIHDTLVRLFLLAALFTGFFYMGGLVGCGASGLLPQTSLPLPENDDPITISSPDSAGYVVITGSDEAVPESSTIIVTVTEASSSLNLQKLGDALINTANAATCTSELPQCPELSGDNQCQFTANDDGSFTLSVPASLSSTIAVNYLDPTTCAEVEAYEEVVEEGITSIDMDIDSLFSDDASGLLYFLGADADGNVILRTMDPETETTTDVLLETTTESSRRVELFRDHLDNRMMVIMLGFKTIVGPVADDGSINLDDFVTLVDSSGLPIVDVRFLMARPVERDPSLDTCVGASLFEPGDETMRFTRLFFSVQDMIYLLEYEDSLLDVDPSSIHTTYELIPRSLPLNVNTAFSDTAALAGEEVVDVLFMQDVDGETFSLLALSDTGTDILHFEMLKFPSLDNFCGSAINFDTQMDTDLYLGTAQDVSYRPVRAYSQDGSGNTVSLFMLQKTVENVVLVLDMQATQLSCIADYGVLYLPGSSGSVDDSACVSDGEDQLDLTTLDVSDVVYIEPLFSAPDHGELLFIGAKNGGSDFYSDTGTSVFESEDESLFVIDPVGAGYIPETNQVVIIDRGVKGDGYSNVVYYDLAIEPVLW